MSKPFQPQSPEIYQSWINAIVIEASDSLTDWEGIFIQSVANQLERGRELSERQANILETIYTEKTK